MKDRVIKSVFDTILKYRMIGRGDSILISISGGPDSVFLTHALNILKDEYDLRLSCFHLDHMTRDGDSKMDAEFVKKFCNAKDLKLFAKQVDSSKWCSEHKVSFQKGARILRTDLLNQVVKKQNIKKIALGHTADDNIETFFLNLFRGSGLKGLSGISPSEGSIIRPLIETRRKNILDYLENNNIDYCVDRTNLENRYSRNRVRNLLVPFIKKNFSGSFDERLLNSIKIIREENDFISRFAADKLEETAVFDIDDKSQQMIESVKIPLQKLEEFPDSIKKRILLLAIGKLKGNTEDIRSKNIEDLLSFCFKGGEKKEVSLTGNIVFIKESKKIIIKKIKSNHKDDQISWKHKINIGKKQVFKELGVKVVSGLLSGGIEKISGSEIKDSEAYMDFDKIDPPVFVRSWKRGTGERFYPIGAGGSMKLHDLFIDNKIPFSRRTKIPVFSDTKKIIWVSRLRLDERVKIDKNTEKILYLKIFDV